MLMLCFECLFCECVVFDLWVIEEGEKSVFLCRDWCFWRKNSVFGGMVFGVRFMYASKRVGRSCCIMERHLFSFWG